jgi:quercetin dioxygenase-like cupin family protein
MPFVAVDTIDEREPIPGFHGRFVHAERMTAAFWTIEAGAVAAEHTHPHEQLAVVLEGKFELTLEGETQTLRSGLIAVIAPHAPHSGRALTACQLVDIFCPVREDLR